MDTMVADLETLARLLDKRDHVESAMAVRLACFHLQKNVAARLWSVWNDYVEPASAFNDSIPIGVERIEHHEDGTVAFRMGDK